MRHTLAFALTAVLIAAPAGAQHRTSDIDTIFEWVTPGSPGCTVAASQHGKLVVNRVYGLADLEQKSPITAETVFDAGSVVKQFVAASVLLLVDEGRVSLWDDIRTYVPELPDTGHRITVDHLLTHTSGVRDWTGLRPFAADAPDALTLAFRQRGLNFVPGEDWAYSNTGYELLKEMVARVSRMSFGEFARKRLFEPLGMKASTYVRDMREAGKNVALAYEKRGDSWQQDVLLGTARGGSGGLFTTALDLVTWLDAVTSGRLGAFVTRKIQEPATLSNGRQLDYARGLFVQAHDGLRLVWHGGSAAAYKTIVGHFPAHAFSIAIMCNAGDAADDRARFAGRIFDHFVPGVRRVTAAERTPSQGSTVTEGLDLKSKAGLFFSERTGEPLHLVVERDRLRVANGPVLSAVSADRFQRLDGSAQFMAGDRFEVRFVSRELIELTSMEDRTTRYRRAQPREPSATELQALAGRYASTEMGSVFHVAPAGSGLQLSLEHLPTTSVGLAPVDRDVFQRGGMMIRFQRDASGKVVAFDFSNPLNRNIRFTRLDEVSP